jgi:hypothetical protein
LPRRTAALCAFSVDPAVTQRAVDRRPQSLSIRPELLCGPKAEALDCRALYCPTWISAAGPVLTFRPTSFQKSEARTSQKPWSGYRPRLRAMISFWISVVPPKMHRTLKILWHALFIAGKATAPIAGCSRSLGSPAAWSRVIGVRAGHGFASGSSRAAWAAGSGPRWCCRPPAACGSLVPGSGLWAAGGARARACAGLGCRAGVPGWRSARGGARQRTVPQHGDLVLAEPYLSERPVVHLVQRHPA